MIVWRDIAFVRDEFRNIPVETRKPPGGLASFVSRIGSAVTLIRDEPKILVFALLQWVCVLLGYLLWIQMADWIPAYLWGNPTSPREPSVADIASAAWAFVCVGIVSYPVGVLSGCMGAAHILRSSNRASTFSSCFSMVLPQSRDLWLFHWIDGWITIDQILDRIPSRTPAASPTSRTMRESLYYAWKIGVAGLLPGMITGRNLVQSARQSVEFAKDNFVEVAKLRAGYSLLCWIVGIGAYLGALALIVTVDTGTAAIGVTDRIYPLFLWLALPISIAVALVMLCLRPVYVIALCDLYADHVLRQNGHGILRLKELDADAV